MARRRCRPSQPRPKRALPKSARDPGSGTAVVSFSPLEIGALAEVVVVARTKQSRATALDPAAVRRHMNPAAGPARTSALVATTSCCCPDWRDLDGKAKVLDAADEAKDLLAFRTAVEMVGAEVLIQSAVL